VAKFKIGYERLDRITGLTSYRPSGGLWAVVAFVVIVEAASRELDNTSSRLKAW